MDQDNAPDGTVGLQVQAVPGGVRLSWKAEGRETHLYRSTSPLGLTRLNDVRFPIVTFRPEGRKFEDTWLPDGAPIHYQLRVTDARGRRHYSEVVGLERPARPLPKVAKPSLYVDKVHYYLEVRDGGRGVKRYPVALGRNPFRRKLHMDNASTPEGRFHILGLQPKATFYRAYDLDYPTAVDRERYEFAGAAGLLPTPPPDIGGEIQIHGKGIHANWTWGCVALRNPDMDELFAHPEIAAGTPVEIAGHEITAADLASPLAKAEVTAVQEALRSRGYDPGPSDGQLGAATRKALGKFQVASGLPVTMFPDQRTLERLRTPARP